MIVYQGVQQLSTSLSVAQDNALRNFPMDEIISALLVILERPILTDFTTEVKCKLGSFLSGFPKVPKTFSDITLLFLTCSSRSTFFD